MNIDATYELSLQGKIREMGKSFKLDHPNSEFKFENLEFEDQQELLWTAFEDYTRQDTLNQWEYLEEFDVAGFIKSILRGPTTKFSPFGIYIHVKEYFASAINEEIGRLGL